MLGGHEGQAIAAFYECGKIGEPHQSGPQKEKFIVLLAMAVNGSPSPTFLSWTSNKLEDIETIASHVKMAWPVVQNTLSRLRFISNKLKRIEDYTPEG